MIRRIRKYFDGCNKQKCAICEGTEGKVFRESDGFRVWSYHHKCATDVICHPEKHPNWISFVYNMLAQKEKRETRENKMLEKFKRIRGEYCE